MGTLGEYIKKHLEVNAFVIWHHLNKTELNQASYITFVIPNIYTPGHVLGEGLGVSPKQMWSGERWTEIGGQPALSAERQVHFCSTLRFH